MAKIRVVPPDWSVSASSSSPVPDFLSFWGKARPAAPDGPQWHPVAYHLLDVAAVAEALLLSRPLAARRAATLLGLPQGDARTLIVALAALHDLGKFAPAFQAKARAHWPSHVLGDYRDSYAVRRAHTEDGYALWRDALADRIAERLWPGGREALEILAPGVFGHHGLPMAGGLGWTGEARRRYRDAGLESAIECADTVLSCVAPVPPATCVLDERTTRLASWWVSGAITVADWIGSHTEWFPYASPRGDDPSLAGYWAAARAQAAAAVRVAGLTAARPSTGQGFAQIARITAEPTPVQRWADSAELPSGPTLFVIEDVTGSGKTEAAQMLIHRLMVEGRASGAYWAMPTMATANAMYERQGKIMQALYASDSRPSLVLAHAQQRMHEGFRSTVLMDPTTEKVSSQDVEDPDAESSVACAAFLADERRAALLADVGAGTVDQALLGALPSRYNTVRLFGLADKVLVIDEAHAYDAYMIEELQELLRFHAALGGSTIVLSATLTHAQRRGLAEAWTDGTSGGGRRRRLGRNVASVELRSSEYPLVTVLAPDRGVSEIPLATPEWSRRQVPVRFLHEIDDAADHVALTCKAGGAVAWVRNTVDDCLVAARLLRERNVEPLVFHARFAQWDRQGRERDVMDRFGPRAVPDQRGGRVVVATQVLEQSLDLDFDVMISDLAPVDLLVQRAGRLWRHRRRTAAHERPPGLALELTVLSPMMTNDPADDWLGGIFRKTTYVYGDPGVLWRTLRALEQVGAITTPDGLRDLIESVYASDEVPRALERGAARARAEQSADRAAASFGVLKPPHGYHGDDVAWVNELRVPTRLSDPRTRVRLARVSPDGTLVPWAPVADQRWKAWALSEVNVSARQLPPGSMADDRYAAAVAAIRAAWSRYEQDVVLLPMVRTGDDAWQGAITVPDGTIRSVAYSVAEGLSYPALTQKS